jgi:hypothetical protein
MRGYQIGVAALTMSQACSGVVALSLAAAGLTACGSGSARDAAAAAARSFVLSVEHKHGGQACRMLTSDARSAVVGATNSACAKVIVGVTESGADIRETQVWGDAAQVRIGADVVFLRDTGGRWRISGAGCTPAPSGPYECEAGG